MTLHQGATWSVNQQENQESGSGWSVYLALELHPAALLLGFHLLGLVLLDALQEAVSALRVLHVLDAHVDPLGQDSAPVEGDTVHGRQGRVRTRDAIVCRRTFPV